MTDLVVCLQCGGLVDDGSGTIPQEECCQCPPPSMRACSLRCPECGGSLLVGARRCPFCNSTVASRRCPHCTAWNLSEARHCHRCGRGLGDEDALALSSDESAGKCPRCTSALHPRRYLDLDADECDSCGGMFIRQAMMERISETRDTAQTLRLALPVRAYREEERVQYVHCPCCDALMNRTVFGRLSGIIVDVCKSHGVWFDAGELSEILIFIESGGLSKMRERELIELKEQTRALRVEQAKLQASAMGQTAACGQQTLWRHGQAQGLSEFVTGLLEIWTELRPKS